MPLRRINHIANLLYLGGTGAVVYACYKAWPPLGWFAGGLTLLGIAGLLTHVAAKAEVEQPKPTLPSAKVAEANTAVRPGRVVRLERSDKSLN